MIKKLPILFISLFALMTVIASPVQADAESERANLARLMGELNYLSQSIQRYRIDAPHDQPIPFEYDTLLNDIAVVRNGIKQYITRDLSLAREIPPLVGQYFKKRKP